VRLAGLLWPYLVALLVAWGLKAHYSTADGEQLRWILAPTAAGVTLLTGIRFTPDAEAGYVAADGACTITPACAGVNFLIICFGMLVFARAHRWTTTRHRLLLLAGAALLACGLTVAVNAVRIALSMHLLQLPLPWGWLTGERAHRLVGVLVYVLALLLVFSVAEAVAARRPQPWRWRRLGIPLGCYLLVVLGIPLLRGAHRIHPDRFLEHAAVVLLLPALLLLGYAAGRVLLAPSTYRRDPDRRHLGLTAPSGAVSALDPGHDRR
jgi:exosortase K